MATLDGHTSMSGIAVDAATSSRTKGIGRSEPMTDEFKDVALRTAERWREMKHRRHYGPAPIALLDALVEAMPEKVDPKERFLELASRLMGSKDGSWRGIFKHHDEGELVALEVFGVSLEQGASIGVEGLPGISQMQAH
jgi:hypothetical protein